MSEEAGPTGTKKIDIEIAPNQGFTIGGIESKHLQKGDKLTVLRRLPNQMRAVNELYEIGEVNKDGSLTLRPIKDELGDQASRDQLADAIVQDHMAEIQEQAVVTVKKALRRKPVEKLRSMKKASENGGKAKMDTQKGCVSFAIAGEEVIL